jgi:low molecular weight phosphotyrosine protein phosphatase
MSEIVMNYLVKKHGVAKKWHIDSAGTSNYHIGEGPDERTIDVCRRRLGKECPPITHKARQLTSSDFNRFDYILYMDTSNGHNLRYMEPKGEYKAHVALLGSFDPERVKDEATVVEDPYYDSNLDGFEFNFDLITRCCEALIEQVHSKS